MSPVALPIQQEPRFFLHLPSKRYRQLLAKGKKSQVAITAVARELVGFMWSIDRTLHGLAPGHVEETTRTTQAG